MTKFGSIYISLLILQCLLFISLTFFLFFFSVFKNRKVKKIKKHIDAIYKLASSAFLDQKSSCDIGVLKTSSSKEALLMVLEECQKNFRGESCRALKYFLCSKHLDSYKKKYSKNKSWAKRTFVARCVRLHPELSDQDVIIEMLRDRSFFVRSLACEAAVKLKSDRAILAVLNAMQREKRSSLYMYRSIFNTESSSNILENILKIYNSLGYNDLLRRESLELLITFPFVGLPETIVVDLKSHNAGTREAAFRLLEKNGSDKDFNWFKEASTDVSWVVRRSVERGLGRLLSKEKYEILSTLLQDCVWDVRVESAQSLFYSGNEGIEILKKQDKDLNPVGYDVSRYVLTTCQAGGVI